MIPDITLYETVSMCLKAIRNDYELKSATPNETILWYILNESVQADLGKINWFEQAVEVFINRDSNHPKYLDARLFFDRERASIPTIHVIINGENKAKDGIGYDVGFVDEQLVGMGEQRPVLNRQFEINSNIVVTSDNTNETVIIYHVIKSMLISLTTHIQLSGFINPIISGRDIQISQELMPSGTFARTINFTASYELSVPEAMSRLIVNSFCMQMKKVNEVDVNPPIQTGLIDSTKTIDDGANPI